MAKTTNSTQQLQDLNSRLDKTLDSTTNFIDASTIMMWIIIVITVLGFLAGIGKALANKQEPKTTKKSKTINSDKPTKKGAVLLIVLLILLFAIFAFASYCIFNYA